MTRLKFERVRKRMSQSTLSMRTGVPRPYLSYFENRRMIPTNHQQTIIAEVLNIDPRVLLEDAVLKEDA